MEPAILIVVGAYFVVSLSIGFWVARKEKAVADDYFLAGRKLPWYAVAMSMTGSNIGTEHFIGMVGTAYALGLAPATYEWGNFIPYSILCWIFLPFFFRKKLYTIPEFLERRYGPTTRSIFAALSLLHMVIGYMGPALYAGGRIVYTMATHQPVTDISFQFVTCIVIISAVTAAYCIYGGLLSVVWTDVLQVVILVAGGLLLVIVGIHSVGGIREVIDINLAADPGRFTLIHEVSHRIAPWPGVATFWLTGSLWYVCTNQFYIQRCLGARSEWDAKMGVISCACMKFFLPFIIVFPGLVAFATFGPGLKEDAVYVAMIEKLLPPAGQGVILAALIAAIMSTVSSVLNSAATIWAVDVHKRFIHRDASEKEMVFVGRMATLVCIIIGTAIAPQLLKWQGGIFDYIQDMAMLFAPPISVIFLAAFLWRRAHSRSAAITLVFGILAGLGLMVIGKKYDIPWITPPMNRAGLAWALSFILMVAATYLIPKAKGESYDKDAIWNPKWGRLPESERPRNTGLRNLMFWWLLMMSISIALFIIFE